MPNINTTAFTNILPAITSAITDELNGLGDYGRITLMIDICGGQPVRYITTREISHKVGGTCNGK